jgi:hypothetical protein
MKFSSAILLFLAVSVAVVPSRAEPPILPAGAKRVAIVFSGGHETEGQDKGRPVVLVAGGLGVPPEVFREAFSHVHPAGPDRGGPTEEEARANKAALMNALGKHGITNDRLDEVSNYYRYMRSKGQMWKTKEAVANALVKDGVVVGYEIVDGGAGYSSPPKVAVPGVTNLPSPKVELSFSKDLAKNGVIASITALK